MALIFEMAPRPAPRQNLLVVARRRVHWGDPLLRRDGGRAAGVGGVVAADPPPLHVQFNNGGQTGYAAAVALSVRNEYLHGHTAVVLSKETCANPANGTDDCV